MKKLILVSLLAASTFSLYAGDAQYTWGKTLYAQGGVFETNFDYLEIESNGEPYSAETKSRMDGKYLEAGIRTGWDGIFYGSNYLSVSYRYQKSKTDYENRFGAN